MSFLYVIAHDINGPVKLGLSISPTKRLKQLQTGSATVLSLFHTEEIEDSKVKIAEKALHKTLSHIRLKGEWFNMTVDDAIAEVSHIRMIEG